VLQRFMDAARWWGGEGVVAGRRWTLVGRRCGIRGGAGGEGMGTACGGGLGGGSGD
jgi:hypothetical protein